MTGPQLTAKTFWESKMKSTAHKSNTNKSRHWSPKLRSVKFGDRRQKRQNTRERQIKESLKEYQNV